MFDSVSRLLGFGGVGLASRKEAELWEENRRLRIENAELRCQVGIWRSEFEDAQLKISAWKAKADRRADKILELEAEVGRLRKRDGVRNPVKGPFNWVDQPNDLHNPLGLMPDGKREKYPWRHVPGLTCEQPGKMTIEENKDHD